MVKESVAPKSFSLPASVLDKSKACFRRLQNSPAAQTLVIADLKFIPNLIRDFAKIYLPKRLQWPLKRTALWQQTVKYKFS
jgi:hypothetical protein